MAQNDTAMPLTITDEEDAIVVRVGTKVVGAYQPTQAGHRKACALVEKLEDGNDTTPTDAQIISAVRTGARTNHIADRLGMLRRRPYILRRLLRLEARGLVHRHPAYTFGNSIYWEAINVG